MRRPLNLRLPALCVGLFLPFALRGQIRDGGIDPNNLGKGEWLYYMSSATNRLGGNVACVTNESSLMLYMKSQGIRYVIVKAATSDQLFNGSYSFPQFTSNLVATAHACGMLVFGYNRSYGANVPAEIAISDYVFQQGADGFVWDAEAEWESNQTWIGTNGPALAWQLCSAVRSNWPSKFLAHSPFPIISYHASFPYKEFGYWSDAVMPQIYHFSSSGIKGSMSAAIEWSDVNWDVWQRSLANSNSVIDGVTIWWTNAIKPLAPINDVYGPLYASPTPDKDVMEFIDYLAADPNCPGPGGYNGVNFFRADLHGLVQWASVKAGSSGSFPGQVNNLVMDDPSATTSGGWTMKRTFYNGSFFGGKTDTNSFGTNYLVRSQGNGAGYVEFTPKVQVSGDYNVYQWHPYVTNASARVPFVVNYNHGQTAIAYANQQTNAGNWSLVGRFYFPAGTSSSIRITDAIPEANKVAIADGLKLVFLPAAPQVLGWGENTWSQSLAPVSATNVVAIAAGGWHSLALRADGTVLAWGDDWSGQCDVPAGLADGLAVAAGGYHSLAVQGDTTVIAWGSDDYGQADVPSGLNGVLGVAAGTWHSLAMRADGTVVAWGDDTWGQCDVPAGLTDAIAVAAGGGHSLALRADGTVAAWGQNTDEEGNFVGESVVPPGLGKVAALAAGDYHSLALQADGTVAAWGDDAQGQCDVPPGLAGVVAISAGSGHSVALKADGTVVAWGMNWSGQGQGPTSYYDVVGVAAGSYNTLALVGGNLPPPRLRNPAFAGGQFRVLLQTIGRQNYALESTDSPTSANWTRVSSFAGNGAVQLLREPASAGLGRFYRVRRWQGL